MSDPEPEAAVVDAAVPPAATWYEATKVASPERARLNYDLDVDVCVIGAGLAGLTVAREIALRGWSVAVLEAGHIASAASGRNTGFVLPGFSESLDDMVERIGLDHARQLWTLSEQGVEYVRRTIEETAMPGVDPKPGWLHVSKTDNSREQAGMVERERRTPAAFAVRRIFGGLDECLRILGRIDHRRDDAGRTGIEQARGGSEIADRNAGNRRLAGNAHMADGGGRRRQVPHPVLHVEHDGIEGLLGQMIDQQRIGNTHPGRNHPAFMGSDPGRKAVDVRYTHGILLNSPGHQWPCI